MGEKIIGILGGMGPEATLDLAAKIIKSTPARKEQDHCRMIIDNNPKIENRTEAIFSGRTDKIISQLSLTALNLQKSGADFILLPCNTAHFFLDEIRRRVKIEILDMLEETAAYISKAFPEVKTAGILGTAATCRLNLYGKALEKRGIRPIVPDEAGINKTMEAITLVKEKYEYGKAGEILAAEAEKLAGRGAGAIVAGCTEIPLALKPGDAGAPLIDPAAVLAAEAVRRVKGKNPGIPGL